MAERAFELSSCRYAYAYKIRYVNYATWENVQNFLLDLRQKPLEDESPLPPKSRQHAAFRVAQSDLQRAP